MDDVIGAVQPPPLERDEVTGSPQRCGSGGPLMTTELNISSLVHLEQLKMSELMERVRALGAPNDVIDECMDHPDPRASLIAILDEAAKEGPSDVEGSFSGQLHIAKTLAAEFRQVVRSLDSNQSCHSATDIIATVHAMIDFCRSAAEDAATDGAQPAVSAEHMLATSGVVSLCAQLLQASIPSDKFPREAFSDHVDETPPIAQAAVLLLSTLAAKQDAQAWFSGSGAILALRLALTHALDLSGQQQDASAQLIPLDEHGAEGAIEPLAAASLANLAWHDGIAGGSSAVAKEILQVDAVTPLLDTLDRGHLRSIQWAAAALCNLSMHGDKARAELVASRACETMSRNINRLSIATRTDTSLSASSVCEEDTSALAEARMVAVELMLGAMSNLAPYRSEEVMEGGAIEAAISVLENGPVSTPRGTNAHAVCSAASSLITETADASSYRNMSVRPRTAQPSSVSRRSPMARRPLSADASTIHRVASSDNDNTSLSMSRTIDQDVSFVGGTDSEVESNEARSVDLNRLRFGSLSSKLAEIALRRPGSARVVTPLRTHVDTLIEHETALPVQETPEEYAERVEKEQLEEKELLRRLHEEEEEALKEEARKVEEEAAIQRAEEEAQAARLALEEAQANAAGILGAFNSTTYQLRYNACVVIQREWRRKLAVHEVKRLRNDAEIRRREQRIQAEQNAIDLREMQAQESKFRSARLAQERAEADRAKADEQRAQAKELLALDISKLTGRDLAQMVCKRSATRANLAPYHWRDLNEIAGPRTLGRAERAANDELARVAALLQEDDDTHLPPDPYRGRERRLQADV